MKNLFLSVTILLFIGIQGFCQQNSKQAFDAKAKILVYFFHGTHRCTGCINAEKATVSVLNEIYKSQQEQGIIKFQSINIEEAQYKALVEKYEVAWNMLLIVPVNNDKNRKELTEQAFSFGTNPEKLKPYIVATIDPLLK